MLFHIAPGFGLKAALAALESNPVVFCFDVLLQPAAVTCMIATFTARYLHNIIVNTFHVSSEVAFGFCSVAAAALARVAQMKVLFFAVLTKVSLLSTGVAA